MIVASGDLRQILDILREKGVIAASFHPDGSLQSVTLASTAPTREAPSDVVPLFTDDTLPPGAYDPVAMAKRAGGK